MTSGLARYTGISLSSAEIKAKQGTILPCDSSSPVCRGKFSANAHLQ